MCQNCNQNNCGGCNQEIQICNQCQQESTCDCPISDLSTDCINYDQDPILYGSTTVVPKNTILSVALDNIVQFFKTKIEQAQDYLRIVNVGTGASIYAGDSLIGEKKIRKINTISSIVTVTENTNDISLGIDSTSLNAYIETNQKTYSATNVGTGASIYKDTTVVGDNTQFNLKKVNTANSGTGNTILKPQVENTNDVSIIAKSLLLENQGTGTSIIKDLQSNTDDNKIRLKSLVSNNGSINITTNLDNSEVSIEIPTVSEIPALIVNSAYTGAEEEGTATKPFKTIQGALDAYKGTGGRGTISDPANPELLGSIIEVYKGAGVYNFTGDFNYRDLNIIIKEATVISSNPVSDWLMDFSLFATTVTNNPVINIEDGGYLYCNKNGFKLLGGDFAIGTNLNKQLLLSGNSVRTGVVLTGTLESHILFEIDGSNLQYVNGGYPHLEINTFIATTRGRMFVIKGNGSVACNSNSLYILTDTSVTITNTYAPIEIHNNGVLRITKAFVSFSKTSSVTYTQFVSTYDSALLECIDSIFLGDAVYFAYNNSVANSAIIKLDSCKMYIATTTSFASTVSGVWNTFILVNNNMPSTSIDSTTTIIVPSAINTIGGKLIETLNTYPSKASAIIAGLPSGAKFINKNDISAGSFTIGLEYKILTIGSTNFTLIGAASNTVGLYFTATGVGTGTGTASLLRVDVVV